MTYKKSSGICYFLSITVLFFGKLNATDEFEVDDRTSNIFAEEAITFLQNMDQSIDPCTDFFNFTCGGYMKIIQNSEEPASRTDDRHYEMMKEIKKILKSKRDIPGSNVSAARNIFKYCQKIKPSLSSKTKLIDNIARKIGLISDQYKRGSGNELSKWNEKFDWIDGVHKLRDMGLNFRFLVGLYVSPRAQSDKRNILEVRKPFLGTEIDEIPILKTETLEIVNAGEFINSLNDSFPLQKLIEGLLPNDTNFSLEDEIRVDVAHITTLANDLKTMSASSLAEKLYNKITTEIERITPNTDYFSIECYQNTIYYDYSFQVALSKIFFTEEKKKFVSEIMSNVLETTKKMINSSTRFDEESRTKSMNKLLNLQMMIGYGNYTIEPPALDWNDVDYPKYVQNILTLSKYQMDYKFRQLNLINDVREWEFEVSPTTDSAGYLLISNSLYMPAFYAATDLHELDLPISIHYGSIGFTTAHELGHAVHTSIKDDSFNVPSEKYNFAMSNLLKTEDCLRRAVYKLTGENKTSEFEDFADLVGYKIAYYTFLDAQKQNGYEKLLPGLEYNSRQMFWIASASERCSNDAFAVTGDDLHSPNYARVLIPLSYLPEFARDFNCPTGSPMNPENKCEFL